MSIAPRDPPGTRSCHGHGRVRANPAPFHLWMMHNSRFWLHGNCRKKRFWFSGIGWAVSPQNANLRCSSRFSGRKSGTTARCTAAISIDQETETQVRNCIKFESVLASIAAENLPGIPPFPAQVLLSAVPKQTENARVRARKCLFSLVYQILRTSWRSGRDSNPRYAFGVYSLSRRAPSTTRPPLRMPFSGVRPRLDPRR